jgi:hypothetical protein
MKTWNFRVLDVTDENGGDPYLTLVEVHYNDAGVPVGYCDPCTGSDDLEGMKQLIEWYALALDKPVLKPSDFVGGFAEYEE